MLGLGFGEIALILVVALLVLGPEKLPVLARQAGAGLREFRRFASEFQQNLNEIERDTKQALDDSTAERPTKQPPEASSVKKSHSEAEPQPETVSRPSSNPTPPS